jgi:hypothetical protein
MSKDISPIKKSKPLTKKERTERKKKRKEKHVSYEWMRILSLSTIIQQSMFSTHLNLTEPSMKCAGYVNHKNRVNVSVSKNRF